MAHLKILDVPVLLCLGHVFLFDAHLKILDAHLEDSGFSCIVVLGPFKNTGIPSVFVRCTS